MKLKQKNKREMINILNTDELMNATEKLLDRQYFE